MNDWKIPTNIKVTHPPKAAVDQEGVITQNKDVKKQIWITFDPIDANDIKLIVYEYGGTFGIVNEIYLFKAGKMFL